MAETVADRMVETLAAADARPIYGIVGDSLNGLTDAEVTGDEVVELARSNLRR